MDIDVVIDNRLRATSDMMVRKLDVVIQKAYRDIEAGAKRRAPVDTGVLRASIQSVRMGELWWQVRVGAEYGVYQEYGTRFMAPQPFLRPTLTAVLPPFRAAVARILQGP